MTGKANGRKIAGGCGVGCRDYQNPKGPST